MNSSVSASVVAQSPAILMLRDPVCIERMTLSIAHEVGMNLAIGSIESGSSLTGYSIPVKTMPNGIRAW